jgi:hypothetical protein
MVEFRPEVEKSGLTAALPRYEGGATQPRENGSGRLPTRHTTISPALAAKDESIFSKVGTPGNWSGR